MKALLIIDMQKISFTPDTPRYDSAGVIERINKLSNEFRNNGNLVVFIQHDGSFESFCIPETPEWQIIDELIIEDSDLIISKIANDSFYKSELKNTLDSKNVSELYITGCATDFCVDSTIKSALTNDYKTNVISDCHTTTDRFNCTAEAIISYFNWFWSEMLPTTKKIEVISASKALF